MFANKLVWSQILTHSFANESNLIDVFQLIFSQLTCDSLDFVMLFHFAATARLSPS